jgi:hypothetical protein
MAIFFTGEDGKRQEACPSAPLDLYLTNDDPEWQKRIDILLSYVLATAGLQQQLASYVGEKTRQNFIDRIRRQLDVIALNIVQKGVSGLIVGMARDKNAYIDEQYQGDCGVTREIVDVADALEEHEPSLLLIYTDKAQEFVSRLVPTAELNQILLGEENEEAQAKKIIGKMRSNRCGVVLKVLDRIRKPDKGGKLRSYRDYVRVSYKKLCTYPHFDERVAEINRIQDWLWTLKISYEGHDLVPKKGYGLVLKKGMPISGHIERHYRNSLDIPLRFYGMWQQIPGSNRRFIHIDDTPTAELDFGCFFPILLLTQAGIKWTDRFQLDDAYRLTKLHLATESIEEREIIRDFLKGIFVRFCFDSIHTPENVMRRLELDFYKHQECLDYGFPEESDSPAFEIIARLKNKPYRKAVAEVVEEYCSKYDGVPESIMDWKLLQEQESRITELVLNDCINQGIPCLPIHDGYLTPDKHKYTIERLMREACLRVTGMHNNLIKIKDH